MEQEKYLLSNAYPMLIDLMTNRGAIANAIYFIDELYDKLDVNFLYPDKSEECIEAIRFLQDNLSNAYDDDVYENYLDNWVYFMNNVFIQSLYYDTWTLGERSEYDGRDTLYLRRYVTLDSFRR